MILLTVTAGCAPQVVRTPVSVVAGAAPARAYVTESTVSFRLPSLYMRKIDGGTRFVEAGSIAQGRILKPVGTVLSVEGADVHEAYAVVSGDSLVGFYLPFEKAFSPIAPVPFPLKDASP